MVQARARWLVILRRNILQAERLWVLWELFVEGVRVHGEVTLREVTMSGELACLGLRNLDHLAVEVNWHVHLCLAHLLLQVASRLTAILFARSCARHRLALVRTFLVDRLRDRLKVSCILVLVLQITKVASFVLRSRL